MVGLEGDVELVGNSGWENQLYREISDRDNQQVKLKLIPYYAWGNRGHSEMTVWLPLSR